MNDPNNTFFFQIDVTGSGDMDYNMYLYDSRPHFVKISGGESVSLDAAGSSYIRRDVLEARIPLTIFPGYNPIGDVSIRMFGYTSGDPTVFDFPEALLVLPP